MKIKKSATLNEKKIITTPLKFLSLTNLKESQHPWWEFEYAFTSDRKNTNDNSKRFILLLT